MAVHVCRSGGARAILVVLASFVLMCVQAACSTATDVPTPQLTKSVVVLPTEILTTPTQTPTVTNTSVPPSPTPTVTPRPTLTPTLLPTLLPAEYLDSYWVIQFGFGSNWNAFGRTTSRWDVDPGDEVSGVGGSGHTIRIRQSGEVLWNQFIDAEEPNSLRTYYDFISTSDGGLLVPILIEPPAGAPYWNEPVLLKFNADGILQWQRNYGRQPLEATEDGGFLVLDRNDDILKLNHEGDVEWTAALHIPDPGSYDSWYGDPFGFYNPEFGRELIDGGILVGGFTYRIAPMRPSNPSRGSGDWPMTLWFARISSSHEVIWRQYFKFRGFVDAVNTLDGGIAVAGSYVVGESDNAWLMKIMPDGNIAFWRRYPDLPFLEALRGTPDGGYLLLGTGLWGYDLGIESREAERKLVKVNAQGYVEWAIAFEGETYPVAVTTFQDGSIVLLMDGGLFARLMPNGHLPNCAAFSKKNVSMRVGDVYRPINEAHTVGELTASPAPEIVEVPMSELPQLEIVPLQWEVSELCRTMP